MVFAFRDHEFEKMESLFNRILDPIRKQFPYLATTKLMQNGSKLGIIYQIDKNIVLNSKVNEFTMEFEDLLSEIRLTEDIDDLGISLNAIHPKELNLFQYDKIIHLFKKRDALNLIEKERDPAKKRELFMNYFAKSPKINSSDLEKILLILRNESFLLKNQVFKEIRDKSFYDYEGIREKYHDLIEGENQEESRKIFILAHEILGKVDILSPKEYKDAILLYQNGFWKEEPLEVLDKIIIEYLEEKEWITGRKKKREKQAVNARIINMITRIIVRKTQCSIKDFDLNESCINVENGVLDISDLNAPKFQPHSRFLWTRFQIPVEYDENSSCNVIENFLNEIIDAKYIPLIYEFLGDCLTGEIQFQKALLFTGQGANGKSTLLSLFRRFLGGINCSETPLHKFMDDKFAVSNLENKLLNLSKDIPQKPLKYTETFKQIVGDQELMGEKKFRAQYCFINHSKHVFSCNIIPPTYDETHAFFRRWMILPFYRVFTEQEQDIDLPRKLTARKELSGLLNKALNGLRDLKKRRNYDKKYYSETQAQWELFSNPLLSFIEKYLEINEIPGNEQQYEIEKDQVLIVFNEFLKRHDLPEFKGTNVLTRKINSLKEYGQQIKTRDFQKDGKKIHVYSGIKFNDRALQEFDIDINENIVTLHHPGNDLESFFKK